MLESIGNFFASVWPYLLAVFAFLLLIFVHELGHFIAAKSLGVKVNEFAIGFGPTLFKKQGKETLYSIKLIPFGGFCAMEGEDEDSSDERAFCKKAPWRRFLIVIMGAVFNILFGILLITITLLPQSYFTTTTIDLFAPGAVSNGERRLMEGDIITEVEGRSIYSAYELAYNFSAVEDGNLDITVIRDGKETELKNVAFKTENYEGYNMISLDFFVEPQAKNFGSVIEQTGRTALSYSRIVVFSVSDMISGRYNISDVSGPVGVTDAMGEVAKQGIMDLLPMVALIAINLGIFNLFPIPALDGGRLVFILIEMIFRKPVPPKYENIVHGVGMVVLLAFMALVTLKDIWIRLV